MTHLRASAFALLAAVVLAGSVVPAVAQSAAEETSPSNSEVIGLIDAAQGKVAALAGAMNDEQWAWRPMEGTRSTSQVLMHIAAANFFIPTLMGVAAPESFPVSMGPQGPVGMQEYEAINDRDKVMAELKGSFDHVRSALAQVPADRMDEEMNVFGQTMNVRGFCIFITTHLHEHLGQLVAYARSNEVVPPWSAAEGG